LRQAFTKVTVYMLEHTVLVPITCPELSVIKATNDQAMAPCADRPSGVQSNVPEEAVSCPVSGQRRLKLSWQPPAEGV
jgi:hypothetical protein